MESPVANLATRSSETICNGELWNGVTLQQSEILELSAFLSHVYIELIEKLSFVCSIKYSLQQNALKIIFRTAIVPITHCFFERLIRFNKIFNSSSCKLLVAEQYMFPIPDTIEEFHGWTKTQKFNQSVVSLLSAIWDLEKVAGNQIVELELGLQGGFQNNISKISRTRFTLSNALIRITKYTNWIPGFGRFPVLTFANATGALHKRFFYIRYFKNVSEQWQQEPVSADQVLRDTIFNEENLESKGIDTFLSKFGFSEKQKRAIVKYFFEFLKNSFPSQFLEGLQNNYQAAQRALAPFTTRALLFSGAGGTRSSFVIGAAKSMGFKIINAQHGGHYGYLKDISPVLENEWPSNDQFLTWGWKELPNHPAIARMHTCPLPSPWLSERKAYWKDLVIDGAKPFDILWMPNMMKRFTGAPQGASSSRRDVINEFSISMIDFVTNAAQLEVRVYCKPYNPVSVHLMAETYKTMKEIGGHFFECTDRFDKGLTYELLEKCKLVLWDQPGTGFLECIACGVPTMILWTRLYCEEEAWCVDDFASLEEVGLIHRTSPSVINELRSFLSNPTLWMNDSKRKMAVQNFSNKYALTDEKWWQSWHIYLMQLKKEINEQR